MRAMTAICLPLFLMACEPADTHTLARVNGIEISAGQAANPQALERIIDRELLVQKALEAGIDKDPRVAQHIDDARRQVLAQAYVERLAAGAKPGADEVRAFYNDNPALFAARRIYRVRQLSVSGYSDTVAGLAGKELDDIAAALKSRGARYSVTTLTQPAEELPLAFLPKLARMKPGETAVFAIPGGATVIQLLQAEEAPLAEGEAQALIEQFLAGRKRLALAAAEVKKLRGRARIEYVAQVKSNPEPVPVTR